MVFIYLIIGIILLVGITLFFKSSNTLLVDPNGTLTKKITFNQNSWHFWYYSNLISKTPPKVLCPYYWCMVFLIVLSPILLPVIGIKKLYKFISNKIKPNVIKEYDYKKAKRREKIAETVGKSIIISLILLGFLLGFIIYKAVHIHGLLGFLKIFAMALGISISVIILLFLLFLTFEGIKFIGMKIYHNNFIQIQKEMIVAIYKKACPIIEWK